MENLDLNNNLENVTTETLPVAESKAKMDWKSFGIGVAAAVLTGGLYTLVVKVIVPKVKAKKAAKNKENVETVEEQR
ncbi:MAG: hypothetical protein PUJ51_24790 [Clostridiales bacterium]|nr:hypothetical protein [Clostridiales bacterium]